MEALLIYAATGAAAGLLAGLFGVGGGLIMVPALAFMLPTQGVERAIVMHVAVATSLAVISMTSLASMLAHHKRGGVIWSTFARLAPGLAAGAIAGAFVAHALPGVILQRIVGAGAILVAIQMIFDLNPPAQGGLPGTPGLITAGGVIGAISALIGIGGGALTVPFLSWRGVAIHQAVGTSAACGVPIAWAGALGFMLAGAGIAGRGAASFGYVSAPAFAAIAVMSVAFAPLGARLAHRLPPRALKRAFAVLLVVVGTSLLLA